MEWGAKLSSLIPAITSLTHKQLVEGVWDGERGVEWGAKLSSLIPAITSLTHKQLGEGVWDGERGVEWGVGRGEGRRVGREALLSHTRHHVPDTQTTG